MFVAVTPQHDAVDLPVAALTKEQLQQALIHLIKVCMHLSLIYFWGWNNQTFELLPEHRFSPNNIHTFRILEPSILPIFCRVNQVVGYKALKQLYIQLLPSFDCYIYTLIYIT